MYTSGTTGRPKGAILTHRNIIWNLFNTISGREDQPGEKALIVGPLFHAAALNNHFTIQVALGGTGIILRKFEPESLLRTIEKEKATIMSGAPALYNMLLQHGNDNKYDVRIYYQMHCGRQINCLWRPRKSSSIFSQTLKVFMMSMAVLRHLPASRSLMPKDSLRKDMSVGKALPFLDRLVLWMKITGLLPPDEVGELVCRGPNVMHGYHRDPEGTKRAIRDGWLHTGDMARMDHEGFFYIVDRQQRYDHKRRRKHLSEGDRRGYHQTSG